MAIKKVGVVGGGLMGSGIAQTAAQAGYDVCWPRSTRSCWTGHGARPRRLADVHRQGQDHRGAGREYRGRFRGTLDMDEFADRDLVIEAIIENLDAKTKALPTLDGIVPPRRHPRQQHLLAADHRDGGRHGPRRRRSPGCTSSIPRR